MIGNEADMIYCPKWGWKHKKDCARRFVEQVQKALKSESPFKSIDFLQTGHLQQWLNEFPDSAMKGIGLGDLSIVHDFKRMCKKNPFRKVYIWALDSHLQSCIRENRI